MGLKITSYKEEIDEWMLEKGCKDLLLVRRMREENISDEDISKFLGILGGICSSCWNDECGCQCWNDE